MKFGVREIANVVFKAKTDHFIGNKLFKKGQPVLYIDSAKTSTMEGAATTVYATGGRGNTRLIAWEGEKTLTFTVEDALLSPVGFAILSGAGLFKGNEAVTKVHVHATTNALTDAEGAIDLTDALADGEEICAGAPIFAIVTEADGSLSGDMVCKLTVDPENSKKLIGGKLGEDEDAETAVNTTVFVDYYVVKTASNVSELSITADKFAGNYYVEADTLFRRQSDGVDMPAVLTFPNVKIQSNFTFSMASSGDPSTFTFTMDALPGYTYFNNKDQVLCVMQIVEDTEAAAESEVTPYMPHPAGFDIEESKKDSVAPCNCEEPPVDPQPDPVPGA